MSIKKSFELLFDLSFSEFITTRVIKVLFLAGIIVAALTTVGLIISGFAAGINAGVVVLIFSPVIFILYVLAARIWCEIIIVLFRIAENTSRMAKSE